MKFVMSYSCGKDSTLALHKMIEQGHEPVCLLVMLNQGVGRSYFHGADRNMLEQYEKALGIPMLLCPSDGQDYATAFEKGLAQAVAMGARAACFGDIDIERNRRWEEERCRAAGLKAFFPLWQRGREENVYELIELGYHCLIKSINTALLPRPLLGSRLDRQAADRIKEAGADVCGENGEYHTLVIDGPIFRRPLAFHTGEVLSFGGYAVIDVW